MSEEVQPTSGAALRAKSRQLITNPDTGNSYLVRKPTFAQVIKTNALPGNYIAEVAERRRRKAQAENEEAEAIGEVAQTEWTNEKVVESEDITRAYVTAALLSPRVVDEPQDDDECCYEDIPESDRTYIYLWAMGRLNQEVRAEDLDNFPAGERGGEQLGDGHDGLLHGHETVAQAGADQPAASL